MTTYTSPAPDRTAPESLDRIERQIHDLTGHLTAATCLLLDLVRAFDRGHGWTENRERSCAAWLSNACGFGSAAARELVRVARALETLPTIHGAFSRGELSYGKVRALTRISTSGTEAELTATAVELTTSQVESMCRRSRKATSAGPAADTTGLLTWRQDGEDRILVQGRLTLDQFEALRAGMAQAHDDIVAVDAALTPGAPEAEQASDASKGSSEPSDASDPSASTEGAAHTSRSETLPATQAAPGRAADLVWVSGQRTGRASVEILIRMLRVREAVQEAPVGTGTRSRPDEPVHDVAA